jgi:uncharacterized protein YhjY with autotransporter beta-barrel domain
LKFALRAVALFALAVSTSAALAQSFTITLQPNSLPAATQGSPYSQTITAVGGTAPYTFSLASGSSLPAGLSLAANGDLTGTPIGSGSASFVIQAADAGSNTGFRTYNLNTGSNSLAINPSSLPNGTQGVAYSQTVTASGGTGPYTYSVSSGSLPNGLSLNTNSGVISGTPSVGGSFSFTVRGDDSIGNFGTRNYTVNIGSNSLVINPATLPNGTVGASYSQSVTASGGTGPYTYSVSSGSLPTGLSLNTSTGAITGTPSAGGTYTFTIHAVDSINNFGSRSYTVNIGTVSLTVNPASLPGGSVGTPYSQTVSATGGTGTYTFSVISGSLPTGLSLNASTGAITGTPSAAATSNFTIQAIDGAFNTGTRAYTVTIAAVPLTVNPPTLPPATQGQAYTQTIIASGGTAPYSYSLVAGALPGGLTLNTGSGVISGTPTVNGTFNFTVQATDATPNTGTRAYSLVVGTNSLTVSPSTLPAGNLGSAYSQTVTASGGTGPYTFTITAGSLPTGLTLNGATGVISGTPTAGGTANFTVRASDSAGNTGSQAYALIIGSNSLTINPATLPPGTQGKSYSQMVTATGGTGPYTYSITAGSLPPGLTLNTSTGAITGTPTTLGTSSVTIRAVDTNGGFGSRSYTLATSRIDPTTDPNVQGLVAAQAATARRFADSQISNVSRHMEMLHDDFDPCAVAIDLGLSMRDIPPPGGMPNGLMGDSSSVDAYMLRGSPNGQLARRSPASPDCRKDAWWAPRVAFWAGGSAEFGTMNALGQASPNRFSTGGLTAGADMRVNNNLIVGAALGYGADRTDIGTNGTQSAGTSLSGMVYASYRPFGAWFLDTMLGYSSLGFDNRRYVDLASASVSGARSGSTWFGAATVSTELNFGPLKFAPYLRGDFANTRLDSYAEQGLSAAALTFDATSFSTVGTAFGMRTFYDVLTAWGMFTPSLRVEYRHAWEGGFNQSMFYSDIGAAESYVLNQAAVSRNLVTGAVGLRASSGGALAVDLEYGITGAAPALTSQSMRGTLRFAF